MASTSERRKKFTFRSKAFQKKKMRRDAARTESFVGTSLPVDGSVDFGESSSYTPRTFNNLSEASSAKQSSFDFPVDTTQSESLRVFVATWNVGGNSPNLDFSLGDFLPAEDSSDLYVLGFQEIVPLNPGKILVEDPEPASRWLALFNLALNIPSEIEEASNSVVDSSLPFPKQSPKPIHGYSSTAWMKACNCLVEASRKTSRSHCWTCRKDHCKDSDSSEEEDSEETSSSTYDASETSTTDPHDRYILVAGKQMVGIFLMVWAKKELIPHIEHVRLSSVGLGIMGYLGNKGCISVSMSVHQTTMCFVCSHLASGEKEGDALKRNSDVMKILKHSHFRGICRKSGRAMPRKILDHERIIWLGDLNYRIALSYEETWKFLENNNWDALFEKDQLKIEMEAGRAFGSWNEGKIHFPPTYKYSYNSDDYTGEVETSKKKRRTPAWCDRILWHGDGIVQLSYFRGESKFSDHRPVCSAFTVEAAIVDSQLKRVISAANMKVGVEELLPPSSRSLP